MSDRDLAMRLQAQYHMNTSKGSSDLGRSDLEYSDPTPNIFALFNQFNMKFFWGKLASVSIRWSKRMYSCAGICRYQGRAGFCEIALSEPLLKLRTRKNLVETLLHEMIHAYLFLTNNDRDRDGHGPKFHEHMFRINKQANVNITVYHTFTDEVRLYQTHWWRCDGICRNSKPFFGTIRRTCNRAPGPSDYWWSKHEQTCGGKFIKIKEPEKKTKIIAKKEPIILPKEMAYPKQNIDIRKFFSPKKSTVKVPSIQAIDITKPFPKKLKYDKPTNNKVNSNDNKVNSKSNILNEDNSSRLNVLPITNNVTRNKDRIKNTTSSSTLNANIPNDNTNILETVRNHWLQKYPSASKSNKANNPVHNLSNNFLNINPTTSETIIINNSSIKSESSTSISKKSNETSKVIPKYFNDIIQDIYGDEVTLTPDNFKKPRKRKEPDSTLDTSFTDCPICGKSILNTNLNEHVNKCLDDTQFQDDFNTTDVIDLTNLSADNFECDKNTTKEKTLKDCPVCNKPVSGDDLDEHLEECLNSTFENEDDFGPKFDSDDTKNISISSLSENEDELNSVKNIDSASSSQNDKIIVYIPCPYCLELVDESTINEHLDECLN